VGDLRSILNEGIEHFGIPWVLVVGVQAGADENHRQQRENVGLKERDEALDDEHEDGHADAHGSDGKPDGRAEVGSEIQGQAEKGKEDQVASEHVGAESHHQGEGLDEEPHHLQREHQGNEPTRNPVGDQRCPEFDGTLDDDAADEHKHEGEGCKRAGHEDGGCGRGSEWNQTE